LQNFVLGFEEIIAQKVGKIFLILFNTGGH